MHKTISELKKMQNRELIDYIQKLQEKNRELEKKNNRNAGRKDKLTDAEVEKIIESRKNGNTIRCIASEYRCSIGLVHKILQKKRSL